MTAVTESDIKELKELIQGQKVYLDEQFNQVNKRLDSLEGRVKGVEDRQTEINTSVKVVEARLNEWKTLLDKVPDSLEKIGELKNWKQFGLVIVTAMVSSIFSGVIGGVIGWLIRSGNRI